MPLFRHHHQVINQPIVGPPPPEVMVRVKPIDGDAVADHQQNWRTVIALQRVGVGFARVRVFTSYDKVNWFLLNVYESSGETTLLEQIGWLDAFGPYLKFVVAAGGNDPAPTLRVSVALASDAAFTVAPG
jgi:hypothetical protein